MSILDWEISTTPFAVVSVETTGFNPGHDRIVEVAVVHVSGSQAPHVVFESLVNPMREVESAGKYGISVADLEGAPRFEVIAARLLETLAGQVIAAHNAHFDVRFLRSELDAVRVAFHPPYVCTMNLRPILGLGPRSPLEEACSAVGIDDYEARRASGDAMAAGRLLQFYLHQLEARGVTRFRELLGGESYASFESWKRPPVCSADFEHLTLGKTRSEPPAVERPPSGGAEDSLRIASAFPIYSFALLDALSDFVITDEELQGLEMLRRESALSDDQVRAVHASVFVWTLSQYAGDHALDEDERDRIRRLHQCLSRLGWAPGE